MVKANNKNGTWCKKDGYVNTNRSIILSSTKGTDFYNKLTQVAKAEPSQTQPDSNRKVLSDFKGNATASSSYKSYDKNESWNGVKIQKRKAKARKRACLSAEEGARKEAFEKALKAGYFKSDLLEEQKRLIRIRTEKPKRIVCEQEVVLEFRKKSKQIVSSQEAEEKKKKIAEEKRKIEEEKKRIADVKKKKEEEEQKRIAEAKKKEEEEQKYRILVKKYGDDCKDNSLGSPEFNKCLKDIEAEDLLQAKLQREFLASLTPEEARAYTCNNTFGFRKGSSNFKDCIFKLYTTELELEKLDLEKQLALAKVEAEKAKADTARAQVEIIQARSAAARAEGKLQEAQIQATKAQTLSMQQQAAASRQQAAAAQAQARAAQQQNSLNLMTQGLQMLSGNQSSSTRLRTNCSWSSIGISCR